MNVSGSWSTTNEKYAFGVFERAFQEFGLPKAIRTDNGVPSIRDRCRPKFHHPRAVKPAQGAPYSR